jgi:hypothetical protein
VLRQATPKPFVCGDPERCFESRRWPACLDKRKKLDARINRHARDRRAGKKELKHDEKRALEASG